MLDDNNEVSIPDKKLSRMVHRILKKKETDSITQSEMESISSINLFNYGVKNLSRLEYAINLEDLIISYNKISSLEPLKSCTKLETLTAESLSTGSIENIPTSIKKLNISTLSLTGTDGFTSLSTLTNLQSLKISYTILDSINFVSSTHNLAIIEANSCKITNLKPLQALLDKKLQNSNYSFQSQQIILEFSMSEQGAITLATAPTKWRGT